MPDERFEKRAEDPRPWHQRNPYAGVKDDPFELIVEGDRVTQGVNKTLTAEAWEETRVGRRCIMCQEPQLKEAFPNHCSLCFFPMKKEQMRHFERLFIGEEWVGSTIDFRAELDRMDAELERENWEDTHTSAGIVIPKGVKV